MSKKTKGILTIIGLILAIISTNDISDNGLPTAYAQDDCAVSEAYNGRKVRYVTVCLLFLFENADVNNNLPV